jgi:hypothetical protein
MLFSLALSWRFAGLIVIVIAPTNTARPAWSRKFVSGLFVPSFAIGHDDPSQIKAISRMR